MGLAVVGTHFLSGKPAIAMPEKHKAQEVKPITAPETSEPVLGFELPGKSYIGTIGKAKGLKATIFGRKGDASQVAGTQGLGLTLDVPAGDRWRR